MTANDDILVAEQFEDAEQQHEAATLGMWTFLGTEILFLGALFASYMVYRTRWPHAFRHGSEDLKLVLGGINTAVLLTSSLTMALAVRASEHARRKQLVGFLIATIVLGVGFLAIKGTEYVLEWRDGLVPVLHYSEIAPEEQSKPLAEQQPRPQQEKLFMVFYFVMTGLHATHMIVGVGVIAVLIFLVRRGESLAKWRNPVEMTGLYWHFVDIVWVFLYPALYLLRQ